MNEIKTYYSENLKANVTVPEDEPRREWREARKGWELLEEDTTGKLNRIGYVWLGRWGRADGGSPCYRWQTDKKIGWGVDTLREARMLVEENI